MANIATYNIKVLLISYTSSKKQMWFTVSLCLLLRMQADNRLVYAAPFYSRHNTAKYRVSLKKGTFLIFCLISVLEVGFYFFTCVSESEFQARFI